MSAFTANVYTTSSHFSSMLWEQHLIGFPFSSENLLIIIFFTKSPFSLVVPRPLYSLICCGLDLIFVYCFCSTSLLYHFTVVSILLVLFHDKSFNPWLWFL